MKTISYGLVAASLLALTACGGGNKSSNNLSADNGITDLGASNGLGSDLNSVGGLETGNGTLGTDTNLTGTDSLNSTGSVGGNSSGLGNGSVAGNGSTSSTNGIGNSSGL